MVQRYEQTRKLQWYKRGAAYAVTIAPWIRKIVLPKCLLGPPTLYSVATGSQDLYYLLPYL